MNIYTDILVKHPKIKKAGVLMHLNNAFQLFMNNLFCWYVFLLATTLKEFFRQDL